MKVFNIKKNDLIMVSAATLTTGGIGAIGWYAFGAPSILATITVATFFILFFIAEIFRSTKWILTNQLDQILKKTTDDFHQIQAVISLHNSVNLNLPMPPTRDWVASPDFLARLAQEILATKPELIVEASSGVSTLISASCVKQLGKGRVISLEHDAKYAKLTEEMIKAHGLEAWATVVHAPLVETNIGQKAWQWYDLDKLDLNGAIDMFVIDGPPKSTQALARFPAIPLMHKHLNSNATILLDDGARPDETEIVKRWVSEFSSLHAEYLDFEKGAFILRHH